MIVSKRILISLAAALFWASPSAAQSPGLALSVGIFDFTQNRRAIEAGIEFRLAKVHAFDLDLTPTFGVAANGDGAFWAYTGFRWDLDLGEKWILTPSFAIALYEQGAGKDLGHEIEFRSGLEIARRIAKGRVGLTLYHLSNGSISERNPGEESLTFTWSYGR